MNTHDIDIKLPPLPYPQMPGNDYTVSDMKDYAIAAIKPYAKRIAQLEADRQRGDEQIYTYHAHLSHPGFGWIDPIMDADCPLIERGIAEDICARLNQRARRS